MVQGPGTFKYQITFFHYLKDSEIDFKFKVNLSKDLLYNMPKHMHKMQVSMRVYVRRVLYLHLEEPRVIWRKEGRECVKDTLNIYLFKLCLKK